MKAFVLEGFGGPERAHLREWPAPTPGYGEVLVKVAGCGLNPVDFKTRQGQLKAIFNPPRPLVMGNECAGTIVELGEGATGFSIGDAVIALVSPGQMGSFAEFAVYKTENIARAPRAIALADAGGLPLAGCTALQALRDLIGVKPGMELLITGGAGGVGTLAIQIAKILGARVTTTASPRGEALVRALGADRVIDYTMTALETVPARFDAAFDAVGGESLLAALKLVRPGGMVVSVAGMPEPQTAHVDLERGGFLPFAFWVVSWKFRRAAAKAGTRYRYLMMRRRSSDMAQLVEWMDSGKLRLVIDRRFPFSQFSKALAYLEAGRAKGKVVVSLADELD